MTVEYGGTVYGDNEELRPEPNKPEQDVAYDPEVYYITKNSGKNSVKEKTDYSKIQARFIAANIRDTVSKLYLRKEQRIANYGDIAVLSGALKANRDKDFEGDLATAFAEFNIPFERVGGSFTDVPAVSAAVGLLFSADDPYNDINIARVYLSAAYGGIIEDFALLGKDKKENKHSPLYTLMRKVAKADTTGKFAVFISELEGLRRDITTQGAARAVSALLSEGSAVFRRLISGQTSTGAVKRAVLNLRLLRKTCAEYFTVSSDSGAMSMSKLCRYIENIEKQKSTREVMSGGQNAVRIMTIHKAKGLEFPVCIIANAQRNPISALPKDDVIFDSRYGLTLRYMLPYSKQQTLPRFLAEQRRKRSALSENVRLLYVALTRAAEKLIVIGASCNKPSEHSFIDIISNSGDEEIIAKLTADEVDEIVNQTTPDIDADTETDIFRAPLSDIIYDRAVLADYPKKISATALGVKHSAATTVFSIYPRRPYFLKPSTAVSPKIRGDAFHKAVHYIDFCSSVSVKEQIETFWDKFTLAEQKALDLAAVETFMQSDIATRARLADSRGELHREFALGAFAKPSEFAPDKDWQYIADVPFVQGIADMFFFNHTQDNQDSITLVDYKTGNKSPTALADEYRGQIEIYARALTEIFNKPVHDKIIWSTRHGAVQV
jgi:ATP-dependent helicase/nuclease subunit A